MSGFNNGNCLCFNTVSASINAQWKLVLLVDGELKLAWVCTSQRCKTS